MRRILFSRRTLALFALAGLIIVMLPGMDEPRRLNYTNLLETIAEGESNGNYNAYYRHPDNNTILFTSMAVGDVLDWQREYVENGSPSSAVGKYQFIRPTLSGLVDEYNIDLDTTFDEELQDKLAIKLLKRRGIYDYADSKITREEFAHNLSKEWAALPQVLGDTPEASYYAGDGLNKERVSIEAVYRGIDNLFVEEES